MVLLLRTEQSVSQVMHSAPEIERYKICRSFFLRDQFVERLDDIIRLNGSIDQRTAIGCAGQGQHGCHPGSASHRNIGFESVANYEALFRRQLQHIDDRSCHDW